MKWDEQQNATGSDQVTGRNVYAGADKQQKLCRKQAGLDTKLGIFWERLIGETETAPRDLLFVLTCQVSLCEPLFGICLAGRKQLCWDQSIAVGTQPMRRCES